MSLQKIGKYVNERLSLFVGIGIIISIHWGWYKLQQVPSLVGDSERKELPPITAVRVFHSKIMDGIGSLSGHKRTEETTQKTK